VLGREQDVAADVDLLLAGLDEIDVDRAVVGARGRAGDRRLRGAAGVGRDFERSDLASPSSNESALMSESTAPPSDR
jgi:hypothetical protein